MKTVRKIPHITKNLKYNNLLISGLPGSGTTTLLRLLEKTLGWPGYSGGEFMLAYAQEKGLFPKDVTTHHDATVYPEDFDRRVDYGVREKLRKLKYRIYESWLAGFLAQGIPGVLKILLVCSDDAVRVDRIVNRDRITVLQAKDHIGGREERNRRKWTKMYQKEWFDWVVKPGTVGKDEPIDFWDPRLYDLTIDTFANSREETLKKSLHYLGYQPK
ncbi:hypothetical protein A3A66_03560 [Microgenomates group bacterium RIFCSPLOWO2_01_FULL_46_13]|nr:MAG: hypothetical protein A2783_04740 [Microgenomates group bacterium RIFCSPHIGHO2_01_FULL_45_11]OGV95061.1 MAG: hypothetical protein A3A66_03560 [Microgenomates group bacterium RIFCSPLOWO2_01_FULL_46_13]